MHYPQIRGGLGAGAHHVVGAGRVMRLLHLAIEHGGASQRHPDHDHERYSQEGIAELKEKFEALGIEWIMYWVLG